MTQRHSRSTAGHVVPIAALVAMSICLVGCSPTESDPGTPPPAPSVPDRSDDGLVDAEFDPAAPIEQNLAVFDQINRESLRHDPMPGGRVLIDALRSHGLEATALEVTPDFTPRGHAADAVQFSVRFGDECLLGQASEQGYSSTVAEVLADGRCLVGITRTIDW